MRSGGSLTQLSANFENQLRQLCLVFFCTTLAIPFLVNQSFAEPRAIRTQDQLVELFEKACLRTGANPSAIVSQARALGFHNVGESHWGSSDTAVNVFVFVSKKKAEKVEIQLMKLDEASRWGSVSVPFDYLAQRKQKTDGCAVAALKVPVVGLSNKLTKVVQKYGDVKLKNGRGGAVGRGKATINGKSMQVVFQEFQAGANFPFAFISIVKRR